MGNVDVVYKELVNKVLTYGEKKGDRTNTGTISLFGNQIEIDLQQGFPLMTTKRVFWRAIVAETIMFLRGITDLKFLLDVNVDIWTRDAYKKFLKENPQSEFTLDEFREYAKVNGYDLGEIYGSQWTNFNGDGVNQLSQTINEIKNNPNSRRLKIYSANPSKAGNQTLPPCHDAFQFYVINGRLDCLFQMRSSDVFHGLSFNIGSYALITYVVAKMTGLKVGRLIAQLGDTHIYLTHLDAINEQLKREPLPLPTLELDDIVSSFNDIGELDFEHIKLINYNPHGKLTAPQAF